MFLQQWGVSCKDIMETRRAGLANLQSALHRVPRTREVAHWRGDYLTFPPSTSFLHARLSLWALSWCLVLAGCWLVPLTLIHCQGRGGGGEEKHPQEELWPRESGGRKPQEPLRPQDPARWSHCRNFQSQGPPTHVQACLPPRTGHLLFTFCA